MFVYWKANERIPSVYLDIYLAVQGFYVCCIYFCLWLDEKPIKSDLKTKLFLAYSAGGYNSWNLKTLRAGRQAASRSLLEGGTLEDDV